MKKILTFGLLLAVIATYMLPANSQVLWRSAKILKKGSFIAMGELFYFDLNKVYDSTTNEWKSNPNDNLKSGLETMIGYSPADNLEVMAHIPFYFHSIKDSTLDKSNAALGDIWFKARYGILPWAKDKHGLTACIHMRLPTGEDDNSTSSFLNTGDGTTDFGFAGIYSSPWINKFRGHIKLNFWFNGENGDTKKKPGTETKLILKLDRNFNKKIMGFTTYIYYDQAKLKNDGQAVQNSDKIRHTWVLGGIYKPKAGIFIRPKILLNIGGENGKVYTIAPKLDIWYIFSL